MDNSVKVVIQPVSDHGLTGYRADFADQFTMSRYALVIDTAAGTVAWRGGRNFNKTYPLSYRDPGPNSAAAIVLARFPARSSVTFMRYSAGALYLVSEDDRVLEKTHASSLAEAEKAWIPLLGKLSDSGVPVRVADYADRLELARQLRGARPEYVSRLWVFALLMLALVALVIYVGEFVSTPT